MQRTKLLKVWELIPSLAQSEILAMCDLTDPNYSLESPAVYYRLVTTLAPMERRWVGPENRILAGDQAVHRWYRFVLSFPPHLVRDYLSDFGVGATSVVLDPFCGTGTTLVEAKLQGVPSVGIEAAPMAHFASAVKTNWEIDPDGLMEHAEMVAGVADAKTVGARKLRQLEPERLALLIANSISPKPLHRVLVLTETLKEHYAPEFYDHERLALAKILPTEIGNLRFGPEVGLAPRLKDDAPVIELWLSAIATIAEDIRAMRSSTISRALHGDAREPSTLLARQSIDAVFTSPPYPNEKDYTRTTRLESVLLGFFSSKDDLRTFKKQLVRSNTRGIYRDDNDDAWVHDHAKIARIARAIEDRRIELGKTSGFERQYARVTKLYFGGMARHFEAIKAVLKPGARLGYVVGDQASYLRVMIRTGELLANIAESRGYRVDRLDLFRTRPATATRELLREEVLVLTWPGR